MEQNCSSRRGVYLKRVRALLDLLCIAALGWPLLASGQDGLDRPVIPRDQKVELLMKIMQPFTVVAVGDMLQMVPVSKNNDPDVQFLMNLMRNADVTVANNENIVVDTTTFRGPVSHLEVPAVVADDWANMGIKMMTRANNHTFDDGDAGLWADFHELDRVGIAHAGAGQNMTEARLARFYATPKGTVGLVGVYAVDPATSRRIVTVTKDQLQQIRAIRDSIAARRNEVPWGMNLPAPDPENETSEWGVRFKVGGPDQELAERPSKVGEVTSKRNTLRLTTYNGVTREQMAEIRAIAGATGPAIDNFSAFGVSFRVTPGPGEYHYDMNLQDERDILREVKTGKQFFDFQIATSHWHQAQFAFEHSSIDHYPADYQIKFAHDCIDQGADLFFAHGVHSLKGIEIYKGKPIFYGVSNFITQPQIYLSWRDASVDGEEPPTPLTGPIVGEAEHDERTWQLLEQPESLETVLTSSHYENGKLTEVRIYPVDLGGPDRPGSQLGTPKKPKPATAQKILEEIVEYSKPFGTKIEIQNGVGIIHVSSAE